MTMKNNFLFKLALAPFQPLEDITVENINIYYLDIKCFQAEIFQRGFASRRRFFIKGVIRFNYHNSHPRLCKQTKRRTQNVNF